MDTKKIKFIVLLSLLFCSKLSYSQWFLNLKVGLSKTKTVKLGGSPYVYQYQSQLGGMSKLGELKDYTSLDIRKKIRSHNFIFTYSLRAIELANEVYLTPYKSDFSKTYESSFGTTLKLIGLSYGYDFNFHFFSKNSKNTLIKSTDLEVKNIQKHRINFSVSPFFGVGVNYIRNTNWAGYAIDNGQCIESTADSSNGSLMIGSNTGWDKFDCDNLDKVVKNRTGFVIYGGVKFSFLKKNKEKLSINFIYHKTFQTYLEATYFVKIKDVDQIQSATFKSNGTNWSIYLSYPITILNKKGERYRDRHPKE